LLLLLLLPCRPWVVSTATCQRSCTAEVPRVFECHETFAAAAAMQTMGREHRDMDVPALIAKLKKSHRWHVETA
jgi:hypothetical protein